MTVWFSLRRRLLVLLLGGVAICWLATLVWTYFDAHHEVDEMLDAQLAQSAQVLLARSRHDVEDGVVEELEGAVHRYQRKLMFQIWDHHGHLVLRSPNAPMVSLTDAEGFSEVNDSQGHWRYFSQWGRHHRLRVVVAENHEVRDELILQIVTRMLVPGVVSLVVLGLWVWMVTRRGLLPLDVLARQIGARDPARLLAVAPESAPEEIRPLLEALNDLFLRVERAIENERRFTADAAHELRTPLAALAAQAQVATRARDETERSHALDQLSAGMARACHLVDQLLTLARLDPDGALPSLGPVALDRLAEEVCADHGTPALAKDITLELDAVPVTLIAADGDLLRILLRNLLDNAIRYTPCCGHVAVTVANSEAGLNHGGATLVVTDSGPGIPAPERERMFERFSRLAGQETAGSGLGLSIVRRIAKLHGARVSLGEGEGGGGLAVTVSFGAVADLPGSAAVGR